jgi:DNA repair protein RadD
MKNISSNSKGNAVSKAPNQIKPTTKRLRPYQIEAVSAVLSVIDQTDIMHIVEMPTGSGTTRVIAAIAENLEGRQVLILTPRCKLLKQTRTELGEHGVLSGLLGNDLGDDHELVIATNQTAIRRRNLTAPDVILIDEVHLIPDVGMYARLLAAYPRAKVIGFTATPYRDNRHLVKGICDMSGTRPWKVLYQQNMIELIRGGYLVAPRSMSTPASELFNSDEKPCRLVVTQHNIVHLVDSIEKNGRRRCVLFCEDINHAKATASFLREQGQTSVYLVHSKLPPATQEDAYKKFEHAHGISWLVNVGLVSIGVDIPCIDSVAIMRDVGSIALLIQMIGRGLRPFKGKPDCLIYDFGNGTSRFGFIDSPKLSQANPIGNEGNHFFKTCPDCETLLHPFDKVCKHCAYVFVQPVKINAEAKSVQLLSKSTLSSSLELTDHLIVNYGGASQEKQSNGTWLITHALFDGTRKLIALDAKAEYSDEPGPYQLGDEVLVKVRSGSYVDLQYRINVIRNSAGNKP